MKILFLSHYPHLLGANRSLLSLVEGLRAKGVLVQVWCNEAGGFTETLAEKNIPFKILPYHNWAATFLHPSFFMLPYAWYRNHLLLPSLVEEAREFNPNIIHTNSSVLGIGSQLAEKLDKPHIWHVREFARAHYNMRFIPSKNILPTGLKKAKKVIAISEAIKKGIGEGQTDIDWEVIYNGVLDEQQIPPATVRSVDRPLTFISVGMLHPAKHQLEALQAFALMAQEYPQARLHIVGTGRKLYTRKLEQFARRNQLTDRIIFKGFIKAVSKEYQQADVLLFCSRDEGMGRVTVEAMAHGLPVIGYRGGATPELIDDRQDGFLYDQGPAELAEKMRLFLQQPKLLQSMGERGREKAFQRFTIQQYIDKMYEVFQEVYPF